MMKGMVPLLDEEQQCLFCKKPKTWRSILICLDPRAAEMPLFVVSVCPDCRKKHTISEMYEAAISKIHELTKEFLEDQRARLAVFLFHTPKEASNLEPTSRT